MCNRVMADLKCSVNVSCYYYYYDMNIDKTLCQFHVLKMNKCAYYLL